ncbi:AmmeMemoRadiSam system radical SAM enzyme [Thermodesulfobacteriota bacterium]
MHEALLYEKLDGNVVRCSLCPHCCTITPNAAGICGVRKNMDGTLYSLVYGKAIAEHADPIEKKPLFHVLPGSRSYSVATVGCNLTCRHCQNSEISQMPRDRGTIMGLDRAPEDILQAAQRFDCQSLSFTYTEPTIYFEYAFDIARIAHAAGLLNTFVSNGFSSIEALEMIAPYLDAANIDLKAFSDDFYLKNCGARLQPILDAIRAYKRLGIWIEITTLVIPGLNDSPEELQQIAAFIAETGIEIPWHVTAFYPTYRLTDRSRTPVETLVAARSIGLEAGLRYVYTGNIPGDAGENTYCYECGELLIQRSGFQIIENTLQNRTCPQCSAYIDGI